jgi:hypothetical protein
MNICRCSRQLRSLTPLVANRFRERKRNASAQADLGVDLGDPLAHSDDRSLEITYSRSYSPERTLSMIDWSNRTAPSSCLKPSFSGVVMLIARSRTLSGN